MSIEELRALLGGQLGRVTVDDLRAWATLIFAGVAAYVGWTRHRRDSIKAAKEQQGPWSVREQPLQQDGIAFQLRVEEADRNSFRLHALRVVAPKGAKISDMDWVIDEEFGNGHYVPDAWVSNLVVNKDMAPDTHFGVHTRTMHYSTFSFMVQMPPRPFWSRKLRTRLVLDVAAEPMSSSRSEIRLRVRSHPIEWAARSAASAT